MQGQNNWGNWGSPGVMKLWVAWEVLRWLSSGSYVAEVFGRSWLRHPTTVSSMWTLPQIVKIQNGTKGNAIRKSPSGSIIIGSMPLLIMRSPPTWNKCPFGPLLSLLIGSPGTNSNDNWSQQRFEGNVGRIVQLSTCSKIDKRGAASVWAKLLKLLAK